MKPGISRSQDFVPVVLATKCQYRWVELGLVGKLASQAVDNAFVRPDQLEEMTSATQRRKW